MAMSPVELISQFMNEQPAEYQCVWNQVIEHRFDLHNRSDQLRLRRVARFMEKLNRGHLAIDLRFDGFEHEIRGHPNKGRALQIMAPLIARAGQGLAQRFAIKTASSWQTFYIGRDQITSQSYCHTIRTVPSKPSLSQDTNIGIISQGLRAPFIGETLLKQVSAPSTAVSQASRSATALPTQNGPYPNHIPFDLLMEWCEARPAFKKARTSQTGFVYTGLAGEDKWKDDQKITGSMKTVRDKYPDGVLVTRKADGLKHYAFYYPNRMESSARTAAPGSERQQTARTTEGQPPTDSQTITTSTAKSDHEAFKKTPMRGPFGGLGREISKGISDPVIQPINWSKNRIAFAVSNTDAIAVREPQRRKLIIDMGEPEMPEEYVSSSSGLPQHQANPLKPPRMTERAWISGPEWVADYDDGARGSGNELGYRQHSIQTSAANLSPARLTLDNLRKHTREALHPLDIAALPRKDGLDTSEQHKGRALRTDGKGSSQEFKSKLDGFVLASRAIDARQRELGIIINDDIPAPIKQPRGKFFSPAPRRRERGSRPRFNPSNHHPRSPAHDGWD